jgi:hypothetical protein
MLMDNRSIYDILTKQALSEVTTSNLNSATKVTAVDKESLDFWVGPLTLHRILKATRTYGDALPIPELSTISSQTIADGATAMIRPDGTEIFSIVNIATNESITLALGDGTSTSSMKSLSGGATFQPTSPFYLTNSLFMAIVNGSGSEATVTIAYHTLGL